MAWGKNQFKVDDQAYVFKGGKHFANYEATFNEKKCHYAQTVVDIC